MSGHTPGPWVCQPAEDDGSICIVGANLGGLVGAAHCWPTEIDAGGSDRVRANARLIAAAPELLEALTAMVALLEDDGWSWPQQLADARALIAKIEGAA